MGKIHLMLHGQMLHAYRLEFTHPTTKEIVKFEAPLPKYFKSVLENLESE